VRREETGEKKKNQKNISTLGKEPKLFQAQTIRDLPLREMVAH
jgi:hypothetical protein